MINPSDRIESLRAILAADPADGLAWQMLGSEYLRAGEFAQAASALEQAVQHQPMLAAIWKLLGDAYRKTENPEQARRAYTQAIEIAETTGDLQAAKEARALIRKLK